MRDKSLAEKMVEGAVEILVPLVHSDDILKSCEYSPRGICLKEISKRKCLENPHKCRDYVEIGRRYKE